MNIDGYIADIARQLVLAADASGPEARELAERLTPPLHAAIRLALLDALSAAADELTVELAPASVEVRLRSGQPSFAVQGLAAAPSGGGALPGAVAGGSALPSLPEPDDGPSTRINLRMPDSLKARVEAAALREGRSVNAWLVRAATAALPGAAPTAPNTPGAPQPAHRSAKRVTGWAQ